MIPMTTEVAAGFTQKAHQVSSGVVTFLNERQVYIMNFNYDGLGPGELAVATVADVALGSLAYK